jgi:hypothetical protein
MHHTPSHLFLPQVPEIDVANAEYPIATFEKKLFSMITEEVKAKIAETPERKTFVLFGSKHMSACNKRPWTCLNRGMPCTCSWTGSPLKGRMTGPWH